MAIKVLFSNIQHESKRCQHGVTHLGFKTVLTVNSLVPVAPYPEAHYILTEDEYLKLLKSNHAHNNTHKEGTMAKKAAKKVSKKKATKKVAKKATKKVAKKPAKKPAKKAAKKAVKKAAGK